MQSTGYSLVRAIYAVRKQSSRLYRMTLFAAISFAGAALQPAIALAATEDSELISLVSPLPPAASHGGAAVSISNGTAVVGAPTQNSAYVYTYDGLTNTWTYQTTLTGGASTDQFGAAVSISGNNIAIGAPGTSGSAGAVYIFNGSAAVWTQTAMLTEPGASAGNQFGYAAAMDGLRLVIGAPFKDFSGKTNVGTAYLFSSNGTNWTLNANINLPPGQRHAGSHIGASVALSGANLLVGGPDDSKGSHTLAGNVFDFVCNGTNCVRAQRLAPGPADNAHLGSSLAILNNTALVGAKGNASTAGHVYVYKLAGGNWSVSQTLTGATGELFGSSVALGGQQAVVGANGAAGGGKSYLFGISAGSYTQLDQLLGSNTVAGDAFGTSITLNGGEAVVGAPFATNPTGSNAQDGGAYAYKTAKLSITTITDVQPTSSVTNESYTVSVLVANGSGGASIPTGTVELADDIDSTATCTATLDGTGAGSCALVSASLGQTTHNIEATYSGDGTFGDSAAQQPYDVGPADTTTTITTQSFNPSAVGQSVTFTVSVTPAFIGPAVPTGAVTITDAGLNPVCTIADISLGQTCSAAFPAAGTVGLVATYAGDENFNGSADSSASHETNPANTTTSVQASPEPSVVGQLVTFTVTATPAFGGTPTGSATVSDTSNNVLCTVADIVADPTCTYTFTAAGSTGVVAAYSGDADFNGSDNSATPYTHVTDLADSTLTVTPDHNPSFTGGIVTFTVAVAASAPGAGSPTGSVTITDTSSNAICTVADITVASPTCQHTFATAGSVGIVGTYSGDSNFNSSQFQYTQVVSDAPTHLEFASALANIEQGDHLSGVVVNVVDNNSGNPDAADNSTQITLTLNLQACGATVTFGPVTVVAGVADFSGLDPRFYTLQTGYMLTASSSTALPIVDSNTFDVVTGNMIFSDGFESCRL
jgi:hypothetical protein